MRATYQRAAGAVCFLFLATGLAAQAPAGYVTVSGSHVGDASGVLVQSATIAFAPVNNTGQAISFKVGGAGGQVISAPVSTTVNNGIFSIQLADTALTSPANVCYKATIVDNVTGNNLLGPGYTCVQPAASGDPVTGANPWCTSARTCNWDNYTPNLAGLIMVQAGPTGPPGATGATGATGAPGPPGGSLSYPGVGSDGTNGLSVTGKMSAQTVCVGTACTSSYGADLIPNSIGQQDAWGTLSAQWGVRTFGDSNCVGVGLPLASYGWGAQMGTIANTTATTTACQGGDNIADFAVKAMIYGATTDTFNPATYVAIGTNNTNSGHTAQSYLTAATAELDAGTAKLATSLTDQYYATDTLYWTPAGTWATQQPWVALSAFAGTNLCAGDVLALSGGTGEQITISTVTGGNWTKVFINQWGNGYTTNQNTIASTLVSSPLACTGQSLNFKQTVGPTAVLTTSGAGATLTSAPLYIGPSGTVDLTYPVGGNFGGTFNVQAAPVSTGVYATLTDSITGSATISEAFGVEDQNLNLPFPSGNYVPPQLTAKLSRFTGLTPGRYTFKITQISGTVGISHLTLPPTKRVRGLNEPHVVFAGVIPQFQNLNPTTIGIYNTLEEQVAQANAAVGYHAKFANVQDCIDPYRDFVYDAGNAVIQKTIANNSSNNLHMAQIGHLHLAHCLANASHLIPAPKAAAQLALNYRSVGALSFTLLPTDTVVAIASATPITITLDPTGIAQGWVFIIQNLFSATHTITCVGVCTGIPTTLPPGQSGFMVQLVNATTGQWLLLNQFGYPLSNVTAGFLNMVSTFHPTAHILSSTQPVVYGMTSLELPITGIPNGQEFYALNTSTSVSVPVINDGTAGNIPANIPPLTSLWLKYISGSQWIATAGGYQSVAKITKAMGASATDTVTLNGVTSTSVCSLTPMNALAATNMTTTYISAKATDQITITHAATAGMTYDVICSRN